MVLTGDVHTGWANDLPYDIFNYNGLTGAGSVGVEFVSTSVTSSSLPFAFPWGESAIRHILPYIKYANFTKKGYNIIDLNTVRVQGDFYTVNTIEEPYSEEVFRQGWYAVDGIPHLKRANGASIDGRPLEPLAPEDPRGQEDTTITSMIDDQFDVLGVYPNPFVDDILLEVHLFEPSAVSIELIDMKGASMGSKDYGQLQVGRNLITLNDLNIANGMYEVVLQIGDQEITRKVMRLE